MQGEIQTERDKVTPIYLSPLKEWNLLNFGILFGLFLGDGWAEKLVKLTWSTSTDLVTQMK